MRGWQFYRLCVRMEGMKLEVDCYSGRTSSSSRSTRRRFWMKKLTVALFVVCLLALAGPAWAGVVFNNYPINSTIQAFAINFGYSVSDSFTTDPGGDVVTGVNFGSWNVSGDDITAVDWMIGTPPFSSTGGGSGTAAAVTDTLQVSLSPNPDSYNIYSNSINRSEE